jgi:hypothetical protein
MANLYRIIDKNGHRCLLKENTIQRAIRENKARRKRILKARQFGVSTGCIIDMFDEVLWTPNFTACIIAHEQDSIQKLFRIVQRAYTHMTPNYQQFRAQLDRGGGSKYQMFFPEINSRIYCDLESRGDTIHRLHISESAFIKDVNRIKSTIETVPMGGKITNETTPNGIGNHFYDEWIDPDSNFVNMFFPWYLHDEYRMEDHSIHALTEDEIKLCQKVEKIYGFKLSLSQIAFRRYKQADLKTMFNQEYPEDEQTCFLTTGNAVISGVVIKELQQAALKPLRELNNIKIYREYHKDHHYVIGADTAEGFGVDFSAAIVIDCVTREVVATFHAKLKPSDFAHALNQLGSLYKQCQIGVERNNHGHAVLLELDEHIRYPNIYRGKDMRVGWVTDKISRPIMINGLIDAVENRQFKFYDSTFLQECLTLINDGTKIQAADGKHDDMIMATAIGLQLCADAGSVDLYKNIRRKILV